MKTYRVIGLMSGTSLDGIDVALLRTDGENIIEREAFINIPYSDEMREKIRRCFNFPSKHVDQALAVEKEVTELHADAVRMIMAQENLKPEDISLIGFHGQTISHAPERGFTCQLGDGELLARMTGIQVVNDFREADVRAGGHGAPLVPIYHRALAEKLVKPVAFLNVGGVANVTYVGKDGSLLAFDTGAGNALIDDWVLRKMNLKFDDGGAVAAKGKVDQDVLSKLMAHPFFAAKPPKSLDRNAFISGAWKHLSPEDGAATLTAFTAASVAASVQHLPEAPKTWVVSGGGRLNKTLMRELSKRLGVEVITIDQMGLNGDAIEAEAFGYLAVRNVKGLPISFPETTGVPHPMTGGKFHQVPRHG